MKIPCEQCLVFVICKSKRSESLTCCILYDDLISGIDPNNLTKMKFFKKAERVQSLFDDHLMVIYRKDFILGITYDHIILSTLMGVVSADIVGDGIPRLKEMNDWENRIQIIRNHKQGVYLRWKEK